MKQLNEKDQIEHVLQNIVISSTELIDAITQGVPPDVLGVLVDRLQQDVEDAKLVLS